MSIFDRSNKTISDLQEKGLCDSQFSSSSGTELKLLQCSFPVCLALRMALHDFVDKVGVKHSPCVVMGM